MALVLKTSVRESVPGVRIPHRPLAACWFLIVADRSAIVVSENATFAKQSATIEAVGQDLSWRQTAYVRLPGQVLAYECRQSKAGQLLGITMSFASTT